MFVIDDLKDDRKGSWYLWNSLSTILIAFVLNVRMLAVLRNSKKVLAFYKYPFHFTKYFHIFLSVLAFSYSLR